MSDDTQTNPIADQNWLSQLAHPGQFMKWSAYIVWPLAILCAVFFGLGLWYAFFNSPPDYQMGETVRIMYIHVPNAILAQGVYTLMAASAIGTLVWRHPIADVSMKAAAPIGAAFTAVALVTGALWGRPTWGTFWEWDGRMTSTLILFLIYLGLIALWRTFDDQLRAAKLIAVLTLVGALNIPIIRYSVDWWNTLHQPSSIFNPSGAGISPEMRAPLILMVLAIGTLFAVLQTVRMRTEITARKANRLEQLNIARQIKAQKADAS